MTHDDEIQHKIEHGDFSSLPPDNIDIKAYQEIFKVLKTAPNYTLPNDFANKVVSRLEQRHRRSISFEYFWFGFGIVSFLISLIVVLNYTTFKPDLGFLKNMAPLKGVFIFGVVFIVILNWLDHRFVKSKRAA